MWIKGKDFDFEKHEGRLVAFTVHWVGEEKQRLRVGMIGFDTSGGGCVSGEGFAYHEDDVIKVHLLSAMEA